jgi:hypothetical protein
VDVRRLVQALLAVLPAAHVLHDPEDLRPYECDGMAALRQLPLVVVLPDTEAQVVDILKICAGQGCRWWRGAQGPVFPGAPSLTVSAWCCPSRV